VRKRLGIPALGPTSQAEAGPVICEIVEPMAIARAFMRILLAGARRGGKARRYTPLTTSVRHA